jgi:hypothetical protein
MDIFHSLSEENKLDIFDILNFDIMEDEINLPVLYTKYPFLSELEDINELVLVARTHLLQKKKDEMKDLLFEEFIKNQGDFMDIEVPKFTEEKITNHFEGVPFTEEESKLFMRDSRQTREQYDLNIKLSQELLVKRKQEYKEYNERIDNLPKQNNEILKYFGEVEFEEIFWKYISDNGGFKNGCCSKCGKVPTVERIDYNTNEDGTKKEYPNANTINGILVYSKRRLWRNGLSGNTKEYFSSGIIKYIRCCKFLYDFKDKILYKKGYPGKEYYSHIHFPPGQMNPPIQYVPCEEYDFKTKKDLWIDLEDMKKRLSKLEKLINL